MNRPGQLMRSRAQKSCWSRLLAEAHLIRSRLGLDQLHRLGDKSSGRKVRGTSPTCRFRNPLITLSCHRSEHEQHWTPDEAYPLRSHDQCTFRPCRNSFRAQEVSWRIYIHGLALSQRHSSSPPSMAVRACRVDRVHGDRVSDGARRQTHFTRDRIDKAPLKDRADGRTF